MLVATDVAARGIDIDDIGAVIDDHPPKDSKDYLHRLGRMARRLVLGLGDHVRRVQPAHPDAHPAAHDAPAARAADRGFKDNDARLHDLPMFGEDVIVDSTVPAAGSYDRKAADMTVRSC